MNIITYILENMKENIKNNINIYKLDDLLSANALYTFNNYIQMFNCIDDITYNFSTFLYSNFIEQIDNDSIIKKGIDDNKSIYQISIENKDNINKSITTIYRYINNGYLTTKRIDLPYAVKYKKRKHNKKYDYSNNNKIDRTSHTYLDYLSYIHKNPGINVWQLDFLGAIKTDSKNIITRIILISKLMKLQIIDLLV